MNELTQKNAELGRFLFCERYTLQPVKNSMFIAEGQNLKRGAVVDVNGVLVGTNSLMPYAVLETDCDTRAKGAFASVFVKGEFNFDKLFFADGLSKEDLDNIVYSGSGIGLVIKPYDYEKGFSPLFSPSMFPAGTSQNNPLMNAEETERMINAMKPIDAMTLRFEFSKKDYNPQTACIGSVGTWTKVDSPTLNVWDWTNDNTDWHESFKGAFPDEDNEVGVIAVGDISSVTDFSSMFAGIFVNDVGSSSYSLTTRNNIVDCVGFDISNATEIIDMFAGSSLRYGRFDLSKSLDLKGFYADTYISTIGDVDCSSATYIGMLFWHCTKLRLVGRIKITSSCTKAVGVFGSCEVLEDFGGFVGDQSNIITYQSVFQLCKKLKRVGIPLDFGSVKGIYAAAAFNSCYVLENTPIVNLTSSVTNLQNFMSNNRVPTTIPVDQMDTSEVTSFQSAFQGMRSLEDIPDLDVSNATNVQRMFKSCYNVKYGILEMYNKLLARGAAITNHTECFLDCGRDTPEGRAALAQIPASWGGTAAG